MTCVVSSGADLDFGLLQRIATRDEAALAELYDRHSRLAYRVIVRILASPSDAEDVLQETFLRVWTRADTYDALLGSPAAWLTRIARNRAIDRLRARRVRINVVVEPAVHAADEAPRSHRALIEAAFFEGYTHSELATRFGVPLGTVKTRIRTGLAAMRDHLEQVT